MGSEIKNIDQMCGASKELGDFILKIYAKYNLSAQDVSFLLAMNYIGFSKSMTQFKDEEIKDFLSTCVESLSAHYNKGEEAKCQH